MPALKTGTVAPEITLPLLDDGTFSLREALKKGPVVLAFFKVSCPVCQFAFPYLDRIYQGYRNANVTVVGMSQDDAKATRAFLSDYGVSFPVTLDDGRKYPASNAYGLTNVPTIFLIAPDGGIEMAIVGWSRADMEELSRRIAAAVHKQPVAVLHRGEQVPDYKPG